MRRRDFISLLGSVSGAWPLATCPQQGAMPVLGFLNGASPEGYALYAAAFRQGLKEAGYVEGQNATIAGHHFRFHISNSKCDAAFPQRAGNCLRTSVGGTHGYPQSAHHVATRLLKESAPRMSRVAMLFNLATAAYAQYWLNPFKSAAAAFAVAATAAPVHDASELESVIAAQAREPNGGLIVMPDSFALDHAAAVTFLAARYRLPASSQSSADC